MSGNPIGLNFVVKDNNDLSKCSIYKAPPPIKFCSKAPVIFFKLKHSENQDRIFYLIGHCYLKMTGTKRVGCFSQHHN